MMTESVPGNPKWPSHLKELCEEIRSAASRATRDQARAEAWELLNTAISRYLRIHSTRLGRIPSEDLEDIAAEKSLDLLRRAELGTWDMSGRSASDITGFLSRVARNGLVDALREAGRRVEPPSEDQAEWDVGESGEGTTMGTVDPPDVALERKEFAEALRRCAEELNPRSRLVWFFRVFLRMSTREIATHPGVKLKTGHVDVLLQRAREAVRRCMEGKGFEPGEIPVGTFTELWQAFGLRGI
jgi:RNA polymerase sigma factor (sigma-70 family)